MATNKPRITVTLEQDQYDLLAEFAKQQGCSMSAAIAEVWAEVSPTIRRVVKLIREAEAAKGSVAERIKGMAIEAELAMMPHARHAISQMDIFEKEVLEALKGAAAGATDAAGVADGAVAPSPARGRKKGGVSK